MAMEWTKVGGKMELKDVPEKPKKQVKPTKEAESSKGTSLKSSEASSDKKEE